MYYMMHSKIGQRLDSSFQAALPKAACGPAGALGPRVLAPSTWQISWNSPLPF